MLEEVTREGPCRGTDRARRVGHRTPWDTHPTHVPPTPGPAGLPGPASLYMGLLARRLGSTPV